MSYFKTSNKEVKTSNDKFLGGFIPQELFDKIILISAQTGKTKSNIIREALTDYWKKHHPDYTQLCHNVVKRALRSWNLVKSSEKDSSDEAFIKNVRHELKTKGLSDRSIENIIEIIVTNGTNQ